MKRLLFLNVILLLLCPIIAAEEIYYPGAKFLSIAADPVEMDFIWCGTNKGLLKYSKTSEKWDVAKKDVKDIKVIAINPLEKDVIWLGTQDGLKKYDRAKNTVEKVKDKDGTLDVQINAVLFDKISKKHIWVASDMGLARFDIAANEWKTYASKEGLTARKVTSIAQDTNGDSNSYTLWVGTSEGLFKYSSKDDVLFNIKPPEDFTVVKEINSLAVDGFYVLIGSANFGLIVYQKEKNNWQLYARKIDGENANDCILSIMVDPFEPSIIWFGTRLHGVIRFDKLNNVWQDFDQENIIAGSLSVDADNSIWSAVSLCSGGGVFRYIKSDNKWLYTDPLITVEDKFNLTWRKY